MAGNIVLSEHPKYQRFPCQIVPESAHSATWTGFVRTDAVNDSARVRLSPRPYFESDLSGCQCTDTLKEYVNAIHWRNGPFIPVMNAIPSFCEMGVYSGYNTNGSPLILPQYLGNTSSGRTFQFKKRLLVPGYENEQIYYTVKKPNIDYPLLEGLGASINRAKEISVIKVALIPDAAVFVGNTALTRDQFEVDRDTGAFTVANSVSGQIGCMGGFYILMLMPQKIPFKLKGNVWEIPSNIALTEPPGGL